MNYEFLRIAEPEGVAVITLNRPDKRNALSTAMRQEIVSALEAMEKDDNIKAVVLTGAGPGFCAGFDLAEFQTGNMDDIFAQANVYHHKVYNFEKPIIAAVNGPALAGGMDLAIMCDFRIAGKEAIFGQPQVKMGVPAAYDLVQTVLPEGIAREICLTGRPIPSDEALQLGLVSRIVSGDRLVEEATTLARESATSGAFTKEMIVKSQPDLFI
ncbi:MAG: enoyl-CoA hydratase/isomerase family protein [Desulfobacterales bacterium]